MGFYNCHKLIISTLWITICVYASQEAQQDFLECEENCYNGKCTRELPYRCICPKGFNLKHGQCLQKKEMDHDLTLEEEISMLRDALEHRKSRAENQDQQGLEHVYKPYYSHHSHVGHMEVRHGVGDKPHREKIEEMKNMARYPVGISSYESIRPEKDETLHLMRSSNEDDDDDVPVQQIDAEIEKQESYEDKSGEKAKPDEDGEATEQGEESEENETDIEDLPQHGTPAAMVYDRNQARAHQSRVSSMADVYFLAVVAGCSIAGFVGLIVAVGCYCRVRQQAKAISEAEYPAYGVTGPARGEKAGSPGDRKLAQSAQMYHFQHQKQQMLAMEKNNAEVNGNASDEESEEENEEGDYTVYECPGLAPTGDMEVRNPLYQGEYPASTTAAPTSTSASPPQPGKKQ